MRRKILLENILLKVIGIILPWVIIMASPQFHIGYWGQVEGMIIATYFIVACASLLLLKVGYNNIKIRESLAHPLILIPMFIGFYSIVSSFFQRLPVMALFGSPQIGQGSFWYFSLSILTIFYLIINTNTKWMYLLLLNIFLLVLVISIGSFYPAITGVVISFFGFNDWIALYFVSFFILLQIVINEKMQNYRGISTLLTFLALGPLFWIIDNNSAIALWLLIFLAWIIWYVMSRLDFNIVKYIYNPLIFTFIPVFLSIIMLLTSFIYWDGETDQTNIITNTENWIGHLGTLVARGSIVRVLFEHLISFKAILFGYGWGSISELLIASFTPEVFYQINTGNRVHFHTHNEIFEHVFSIGLVGALIYVFYTYYIFKYAFRNSQTTGILWLLYLSISAFWFQWVSNLVVQALLLALLINLNNLSITSVLFNKFKELFRLKLVYSFCLLFISLFLFYGAYIGYFTAKIHMNSVRASHLITMATNAENNDSVCSKGTYDFGKGSLQFSQKFNGFNNYFKDQVLLYGIINDSDYLVLNWYLCASDTLINEGHASLELINVHINVLSMISILPGEIGTITRDKAEKYINLWENKLDLLLSIAPKRVDQATALISYYLKSKNHEGVKRICQKIGKSGFKQGYCDLSLGAILLEEGVFDEGMLLIKKAYDSGVLDTEDIDKETADSLKIMIKKYYDISN